MYTGRAYPIRPALAIGEGGRCGGPAPRPKMVTAPMEVTVPALSRSLSPRAGLFFLAALAACETRVNPPKPDEDTGAPAALRLDSVAPTSGPASGGTSVTLRGVGFSEASTARVGDDPCTSLTFLAETELVCVTPPGPAGSTLIVVEVGEEAASAAYTRLPDGDTGDPDTGDPGDTADTSDTSDPDDTGTPGDTAHSADTADSADTSDPGDTAVPVVSVDYCHIQYPCEQSVAAGVATDAVYGWVYQAGVTEGPGVGVGVTLEVGWGADGSDPATGWTWTTMRYNLDKDGLVPGDLANDEWFGAFTAPTVPGAYDFAVRASADGGASWTYCDGGGGTCPGSGSDDGYDAADAGALTVR